MSRVMSVLARLGRELDENQRLRYGLFAIALLAVFYALSGLSAMRSRISADYTQDLERLERIQHTAEERGWNKRAADAQSLLAELQAQIPHSDSVGLAQATFQGWLRSAAIATDPKLNIHIGTPQRVADNSPYWEIPAQLAGSLSHAKALELLRRIESRKDLVVIKRIRLSVVRPASLSLDVVAYYRIDTKGAGS